MVNLLVTLYKLLLLVSKCSNFKLKPTNLCKYLSLGDKNVKPFNSN